MKQRTAPLCGDETVYVRCCIVCTMQWLSHIPLLIRTTLHQQPWLYYSYDPEILVFMSNLFKWKLFSKWIFLAECPTFNWLMTTFLHEATMQLQYFHNISLKSETSDEEVFISSFSTCVISSQQPILRCHNPIILSHYEKLWDPALTVPIPVSFSNSLLRERNAVGEINSFPSGLWIIW